MIWWNYYEEIIPPGLEELLEPRPKKNWYERFMCCNKKYSE